MANAPGWLKAIGKVERAIGEPLSRATNSDEGAAAMLAVERLRRAAGSLGGLAVNGAVHLLHLPSRRDGDEGPSGI